MITYYRSLDTSAHMRVYNDRGYAEIWAVPPGAPKELTHIATWELPHMTTTPTVSAAEKILFNRAAKEMHTHGLVPQGVSPQWGKPVECHLVAYGTFPNQTVPNIVVINRDVSTVELIVFGNHGTAKMRIGLWSIKPCTLNEAYVVVAKNRMLQHMSIRNPAITDLNYMPL